MNQSFQLSFPSEVMSMLTSPSNDMYKYAGEIHPSLGVCRFYCSIVMETQLTTLVFSSPRSQADTTWPKVSTINHIVRLSNMVRYFPQAGHSKFQRMCPVIQRQRPDFSLVRLNLYYRDGSQQSVSDAVTPHEQLSSASQRINFWQVLPAWHHQNICHTVSQQCAQFNKIWISTLGVKESLFVECFSQPQHQQICLIFVIPILFILCFTSHHSII